MYLQFAWDVAVSFASPCPVFRRSTTCNEEGFVRLNSVEIVVIERKRERARSSLFYIPVCCKFYPNMMMMMQERKKAIRDRES